MTEVATQKSLNSAYNFLQQYKFLNKKLVIILFLINNTHTLCLGMSICHRTPAQVFKITDEIQDGSGSKCLLRLNNNNSLKHLFSSQF